VILYADSSGLAKLYLDEPHSDDVEAWVLAADAVATSRVTYAEVASALARRHAAGSLSDRGLRVSLGDLAEAWGEYLVVDLAERSAGDLAVRHVLRGLDAVHLAAALTLRDAVGPDGLALASFDAALNRAAVREGLIVLEPGA
jgi:predicted nucleic acid-binding protein